jgi:dolichol-phosphate mannosyltransferase
MTRRADDVSPGASTLMAAKDMAPPELDIVIPVYNEGRHIVGVLDTLQRHVQTPFRVFICYDHDEDDTLAALKDPRIANVPVQLVKNRGRGVLGAVLTGFAVSSAPAALVFPADDDYNATQLDAMVAGFRDGNDIVCASRFIPGGCMVGCRRLKATLVRSSAWALHHLARLPTRDASNGFRLFSQRVLRSLPVESQVGFAYSLELLVKAHRLGWKVSEVPVAWYERKAGQSRFRVLRWLPQYLQWFGYAFATTWLRRGPRSVKLKEWGDVTAGGG